MQFNTMPVDASSKIVLVEEQIRPNAIPSDRKSETDHKVISAIDNSARGLFKASCLAEIAAYDRDGRWRLLVAKLKPFGFYAPDSGLIILIQTFVKKNLLIIHQSVVGLDAYKELIDTNADRINALVLELRRVSIEEKPAQEGLSEDQVSPPKEEHAQKLCGEVLLSMQEIKQGQQDSLRNINPKLKKIQKKQQEKICKNISAAEEVIWVLKIIESSFQVSNGKINLNERFLSFLKTPIRVLTPLNERPAFDVGCLQEHVMALFDLLINETQEKRLKNASNLLSKECPAEYLNSMQHKHQLLTNVFDKFKAKKISPEAAYRFMGEFKKFVAFLPQQENGFTFASHPAIMRMLGNDVTALHLETALKYMEIAMHPHAELKRRLASFADELDKISSICTFTLDVNFQEILDDIIDCSEASNEHSNFATCITRIFGNLADGHNKFIAENRHSLLLTSEFIADIIHTDDINAMSYREISISMTKAMTEIQVFGQNALNEIKSIMSILPQNDAGISKIRRFVDFYCSSLVFPLFDLHALFFDLFYGEISPAAQEMLNSLETTQNPSVAPKSKIVKAKNKKGARKQPPAKMEPREQKIMPDSSPAQEIIPDSSQAQKIFPQETHAPELSPQESKKELTREDKTAALELEVEALIGADSAFESKQVLEDYIERYAPLPMREAIVVVERPKPKAVPQKTKINASNTKPIKPIAKKEKLILTGRDLKLSNFMQILKERGYRGERQNGGSHLIVKNQAGNTLPVPQHKSIKKPLAYAILGEIERYEEGKQRAYS